MYIVVIILGGVIQRMEKLMKNFFLFMAGNQSLNKLAKKHGLRFGGSRFVAGETLEAAIDAVKKLNENGLMVTLDHLGEFVSSKEEASAMTAYCMETLKAIASNQVDSNLSLKLTSMGLDISYDFCLNNMRKILELAKELNIFVRFDMEDYAHLDQTLKLFRDLRKEYDHFGLVIQAYLYRTEEDIVALAKYGTNLRLVKGAYKESPDVAFPDKKDVDENYQLIIRRQLEYGNYAAVATHDDAMIAYTKQLVKDLNISNDRFEFQFLYGIRTELQKSLVEEGYRVRVYVPYGNDWYGYFMRRLAERPANVAFVLKGMVKK